MRKWILSLAALALVVSPAFAGKYNKVLSIGDKAPGFDALPAVTSDAGDTSVSLADVKEEVIVVAFLANHCPAVVATEDRFIDLAKSFGDKSVKVIGISVTADGQKDIDDIPAIKSQVKKKGYNFTYAYDESQKTGKAYGAAATPTVIVLDKARNVQYIGALDDSTMNEAKVSKNYVKEAVNALLAGKEVEVKETKAVGCGIHYIK
jgi:peroxiredoxin